MWPVLLVSYAGLLWVPFYNKRMPDLFGFPFFYWYQLLFVPITTLMIYPIGKTRINQSASRREILIGITSSGWKCVRARKAAALSQWTQAS
jgi:hypothetical protein